jgi:hypothetical protein
VEAKHHMKIIATALGTIVEHIISASTNVKWT